MDALSDRAGARDSYGRAFPVGTMGVVPGMTPELSAEVTRSSNQAWMRENQQRMTGSVNWASNQTAHFTNTAHKMSGEY